LSVVGSVFVIVCVIALLYFGLGTTQTLMDDADASVTNGTELSDSLNTSKDLTAPTFSILNMLVWILVLIAVIGVLYLLTKL